MTEARGRLCRPTVTGSVERGWGTKIAVSEASKIR
jgi:hypothetical protein